MKALRDNLDLFLKKLPKLLPRHEGKYALVCKGTMAIFGTSEEAMKAATRKCGDPNEFLVIKIESPAKSPSL